MPTGSEKPVTGREVDRSRSSLDTSCGLGYKFFIFCGLAHANMEKEMATHSIILA